jgi:hypothetical protein
MGGAAAGRLGDEEAPDHDGRIDGGLDDGFPVGSPMIDGVPPAEGARDGDAEGGTEGGGGGRLIVGPGVNTLPGRKRTSTAGIEGIDGIPATSGGFFGVDIRSTSLRFSRAPRQARRGSQKSVDVAVDRERVVKARDRLALGRREIVELTRIGDRVVELFERVAEPLQELPPWLDDGGQWRQVPFAELGHPAVADDEVV